MSKPCVPKAGGMFKDHLVQICCSLNVPWVLKLENGISGLSRRLQRADSHSNLSILPPHDTVASPEEDATQGQTTAWVPGGHRITGALISNCPASRVMEKFSAVYKLPT